MSTPEDDLDTGHDVDTDGPVMPFVRRAPRISQANVFEAADALLVEGHRPTIDRVRMRLGRGSPNTINDHLDAWWTKLGSRLRDLPGREFPQLPERVARALQLLWNEALEGAHETLQGTLAMREHALTEREQALETATRQLAEQERATAARAHALEESLSLAREQLVAGNRRADTLEATLQERDTECGRLRTGIAMQEALVADLRARLDRATAAHQAERTRLEERYAAAEVRWLTEVDRARQLTKESAKEHERQMRDLRTRVERVQTERDQFRQELLEARSVLKTASAVREQLEARLRALANPLGGAPGTRRPKAKHPRKPTRTIRTSR